ncbi:MAG: hypothetical protein M3290_04650, partial [Actinomycetota bacterium]|nr:hypothetical protein [Actinomycetota bacterium]
MAPFIRDARRRAARSIVLRSALPDDMATLSKSKELTIPARILKEIVRAKYLSLFPVLFMSISPLRM